MFEISLDHNLYSARTSFEKFKKKHIEKQELKNKLQAINDSNAIKNKLVEFDDTQLVNISYLIGLGKE